MTTAEWEVIKSAGKVVYYRRYLPDRSYLAVSRREADPEYPWQWAHRGPGDAADGTTQLRAWEREKSASTAKVHADRYARVLSFRAAVSRE